MKKNFTSHNKLSVLETYLPFIILSTLITSQCWAAFIDPDTNNKLPSPTSDILENLKYEQPLLNYDNITPIFLRKTEDDIKDLYHSGLKNLSEGNKNQGIKDLEKAWKMAPNQIPTAVALSNIYIKDKRFDEAFDISKKLKEAQPNVPYGFIIEGFAYQASDNAKKAIQAFNEALKISKGEPSASAALAEYALADKDVKHARELYIEAINSNPNHLRTLFLLANLDSSLGDTKQVETLIENAHQTSPADVITHNQFAQIYGSLKKFPLAIAEIDKALILDPNNAPTLFAKARLLAGDHQFDSARAILKKLSETYPKSVTSRELEGRIALEQNKPEDAIPLFEEALKLEDDKLIAVQLAFSQIRAGKIEAGFETFRSRIKQAPSDLSLRALFAEQLRRNNAYDEAQKQYEEILQQKPGTPGVHNNLAWILGQKNEIDAGLIHAKQAYDKVPNDPNVMDTYAELLLRKGEFEKSEALLLKAMEASPKNTSIRFHLSQAFAELNKNEQAKKLLNELVSQNTSFAELQVAKDLLNKLNSR